MSDQQPTIISFWRPTDPNSFLGQWYLVDMLLTDEILLALPEKLKNTKLYRKRYDVLQQLAEQEHFNCSEKFMMMGKAALFCDDDSFLKISKTDSPRTHKSLGRKVRNFDELVWSMYSKDLVLFACYLKFYQNEDLREFLIETGNSILVEGSPLDKIWGVGLRFNDPRINDPKNWKGKNLLGNALMKTREILRTYSNTFIE